LGDAPTAMTIPSMSSAPTFIVERPAPGIEIDLKGGRVQFDREIDPETIRALVALLEGAER